MMNANASTALNRLQIVAASTESQQNFVQQNEKKIHHLERLTASRPTTIQRLPIRRIRRIRRRRKPQHHQHTYHTQLDAHPASERAGAHEVDDDDEAEDDEGDDRDGECEVGEGGDGEVA